MATRVGSVVPVCGSPNTFERIKNSLRLMRLVIAIILGAWLNNFAIAQGAFQNLDFELAESSSAPIPVKVPFTDALPGWQGTAGGLPATEAYFNGWALDSPQAASAISTLASRNARTF